jgi:reactive intermediate/imine deaminase
MAIEFFDESNVGTRELPRSVATKAGGFVFVSGQVARDRNGMLVTGGIDAHTRQTMENVVHALALAGCTLDDVVKSTVWLNDAREFDEFNRVYGEFFPGKRPARSTMQATNVVGSKIEIEVIAYKP